MIFFCDVACALLLHSDRGIIHTLYQSLVHSLSFLCTFGLHKFEQVAFPSPLFCMGQIIKAESPFSPHCPIVRRGFLISSPALLLPLPLPASASLVDSLLWNARPTHKAWDGRRELCVCVCVWGWKGEGSRASVVLRVRVCHEASPTYPVWVVGV